jgi:hypothetical protein
MKKRIADTVAYKGQGSAVRATVAFPALHLLISGLGREGATKQNWQTLHCSPPDSGLTEDHAMYHTIQFTEPFAGDLEISPKHHLERILLRSGTQVRVQLKPYVVETQDGPREMADLFFEDGTATRGVPFSVFTFVD